MKKAIVFILSVLVFLCFSMQSCRRKHGFNRGDDCKKYRIELESLSDVKESEALNATIRGSGNIINPVETHKAGDTVTDYEEIYPCNNGEKIVRKSVLIYLDSIRYNRFTTGKLLSLDENNNEYVRYTYESLEAPDGVLNYVKVNGKKYVVGQVVCVFDEYNFSEGDWTVYVVSPMARWTAQCFLREKLINKREEPKFAEIMNDVTYDLYSVNLQKFCVSTSDLSLLNEMKDIFVFSIEGGYMTTAELEIYLVHNGRRVFHSDLFLDGSINGMNHFFFEYMNALYPDKIRDFITKLEPTDFAEAEKYFLE